MKAGKLNKFGDALLASENNENKEYANQNTSNFTTSTAIPFQSNINTIQLLQLTYDQNSQIFYSTSEIIDDNNLNAYNQSALPLGMVDNLFLYPEKPNLLQPIETKQIKNTDQLSSNNKRKRDGKPDANQSSHRNILINELKLSETWTNHILSQPYFEKTVEYLKKYAPVFKEDGFDNDMIANMIIFCTNPIRGVQGIELLGKGTTRAALKQLGFTPNDMIKCLLASYGSSTIINRILKNKENLLALKKKKEISIEKISTLAKKKNNLENFIEKHKSVAGEIIIDFKLNKNRTYSAYNATSITQPYQPYDQQVILRGGINHSSNSQILATALVQPAPTVINSNSNILGQTLAFSNSSSIEPAQESRNFNELSHNHFWQNSANALLFASHPYQNTLDRQEDNHHPYTVSTSFLDHTENSNVQLGFSLAAATNFCHPVYPPLFM